ncbi:helix-turn-helix domain-containing protein [Flavobacterium sp. 3-210]
MQKSNKKVIRINDKADGTYLIVSKYILHNKDLKDFDKILLLSILSDADDFNFNITTYAKRFACERDKISRAVKRLVQAGYMKQKQIDDRFNVWEYVISEYGNLSSEPKEDKPKAEPVAEQPTEQQIEPKDKPASTIDFEAVKQLILKVVNTHFPTMPDPLFVEYIKTTKEAIDSGKVDTIIAFTETTIKKSISKFYTEPKELTAQDVDKMVDLKSNGLSMKDTASLKLRAKDWLKNNPFATEQQLSTEILKGKNTFRKPVQGYND